MIMKYIWLLRVLVTPANDNDNPPTLLPGLVSCGRAHVVRAVASFRFIRASTDALSTETQQRRVIPIQKRQCHRERTCMVVVRGCGYPT